jgi:ankyrin repeat protein
MNFHLSRFLLFSLLTVFYVIDCPAQGTLKEAIQSNDLKKVKGLLEISPILADTCLDKEFNCTKPIHMAVQLGLVVMAETLIKNGAKVNTRVGDEGMSPLDIASRSGNLEVAKMLLNNKAEVNTEARISRGYGYVPPLAHAVINNHVGVMKLLLENGAKVNVEISNELNSDSVHRRRSSENLGRGNSPMYLNLAKSTEAAEILIASGIKIRKSDEWGKTHASNFGNVPPSQISAFVGEFLEGKILLPAIAGNTAEVGKLLASKPSLANERSKSGYTPLYYAAKWGHKAVVEQLIASGADVSAQVNGKAAIDVAASPEIANLLKAK